MVYILIWTLWLQFAIGRIWLMRILMDEYDGRIYALIAEMRRLEREES